MFSIVWNGLHWGLSSEQTSGLLRVAHVSPQWPALSYTILVHCLRSHLGGFILLMSRLPLGSSVWALWTNQLEPGSFLYFQLRQRGVRAMQSLPSRWEQVTPTGLRSLVRQPQRLVWAPGFALHCRVVFFLFFFFNFMESLSNIIFECPSGSQWTGTLSGSRQCCAKSGCCRKPRR